MNFEEFTKINHWKVHLIGRSKHEVEKYLGNATDYGAGKLRKYLAKFNDIEVGFNEDELAFYVQIDLMDKQKPKGTKLFNIENWPIYGGISLVECEELLTKYGCTYKQEQTEINPEIIELHTQSNVVLSFVGLSTRIMGKGLVNIRTDV